MTMMVEMTEASLNDQKFLVESEKKVKFYKKLEKSHILPTLLKVLTSDGRVSSSLSTFLECAICLRKRSTCLSDSSNSCDVDTILI